MTNPLRLYRERRKLSQNELAELIGTSKATVSRLETGARLPSMAMLRKIVAATGGEVSASDFVAVEISRAPPSEAAA